MASPAPIGNRCRPTTSRRAIRDGTASRAAPAAPLPQRLAPGLRTGDDDVSKDVTAKIDKATTAPAGTKSNRRGFLAKAGVAAAAAVAASAPSVRVQAAQVKPAAGADGKPTKKVFWTGGKPPEKQALFSPAVAYGNLLFISG